MEINDKIYEEALETLRIKIHNAYALIAFEEKYCHHTDWYQYGVINGLEISLTILQDLKHNTINPRFKEEERTLEDWEKSREKFIKKYEGTQNDEL